jgi:hypothetical protein
MGDEHDKRDPASTRATGMRALAMMERFAPSTANETTERPTLPDPDGCIHPRTMPAFDHARAKRLDAAEVRRRWPRFEGRCPDCGASVIAYESFAHYAAGDW